MNLKKVPYLFLGVLFLSVLISITWANYGYPQGKIDYSSGHIEEYNDGRTTKWAYDLYPSPASNPALVRFLQDEGESLIIISLFGIAISAYYYLKNRPASRH